MDFKEELDCSLTRSSLLVSIPQGEARLPGLVLQNSGHHTGMNLDSLGQILAGTA